MALQDENRAVNSKRKCRKLFVIFLLFPNTPDFVFGNEDECLLRGGRKQIRNLVLIAS